MTGNRCRTTVKRLDCGSKLETEHTTVYEPFSVCLPFGRQLVYDGQGLRLEGEVSIADGQYGLFTVTNGCITGAEEQPVCEYTAQPCTPAASPCDGSSSSGSVVLQPGQNNLLNFDASGRLGAQLNYSTSTDGLTITGYGTVSDPLVINYTPAEAARIYIQGATAAVTVSGSGTASSPYYINHEATSLGAGTYGAFTIDAYGHIIGYSEQTANITEIYANGGLTGTQTGTIYKISMETKNSKGTYVLGGYTVSVNMYGVVTDVAQAIDLGIGADNNLILDPTYTTLTFNNMGSLVGYTERDDKADDVFAEIFQSGRATTTMTITTTKSAFFKITYKGRLAAASPGSNVYGYFPLASPYELTVGNRRVTAYALYSAQNSGIIEVCAITDGYYSAGSYQIALTCSTEEFYFTDGAIMTVELVAKGDN